MFLIVSITITYIFIGVAEHLTTVASSNYPQRLADHPEPSDLSLPSLDQLSGGKKGGSALSLSSLGKSFSQRIRRKSTNIYKKVIGQYKHYVTY